MRLVGLLCLGACISSGGFWVTAALKKRVEALEQCALFLQAFAGELELSRDIPSRILLRLTEERFSGWEFAACCAQLCRQGMTFPAAWHKAAQDVPRLTPQERTWLARAGEPLGAQDVPTQLKALAGWEARFLREAQKAGESCREKSRLYHLLGLLAGCFVLVLLW